MSMHEARLESVGGVGDLFTVSYRPLLCEFLIPDFLIHLCFPYSVSRFFRGHQVN